LKAIDVSKSLVSNGFVAKKASLRATLLAISLVLLLCFPTISLADTGTTPGYFTISPLHQQLIVTATYGGDDDGNNSLWVEWDENEGDWLTLLGGTLLSNTASPYTYLITGLTNGTPYQVRLRWQDDNSPGSLIQTDLIPYNPLVHNSLSTASAKWGGGWGVTDWEYGKFTCGTCHARGTGNIKRIKKAIAVTDGASSDQFPIEEDGTPPVGGVNFQDVRDGSSDFGDDVNRSGDTTQSDKICEACHSQNKFHNYNVADNTGGDTKPLQW